MAKAPRCSLFPSYPRQVAGPPNRPDVHFLPSPLGAQCRQTRGFGCCLSVSPARSLLSASARRRLRPSQGRSSGLRPPSGQARRLALGSLGMNGLCGCQVGPWGDVRVAASAALTCSQSTEPGRRRGGVLDVKEEPSGLTPPLYHCAGAGTAPERRFRAAGCRSAASLR